MPANPNKYWYIGGGLMALILGVLSLGFSMYPQFPSMCFILGIFLSILIDCAERIPPYKSYDWGKFWDDIWSQKNPIGRSFLFLHAKIIFPAICILYMLFLLVKKIKIFGSLPQSLVGEITENINILWVTMISAIIANFSGFPDDAYVITKTSRWNNTLGLILICVLSYIGMWSVFAEIASIGRVAYFVSLGVGVLIALVSMMILTEEDPLSADDGRAD